MELNNTPEHGRLIAIEGGDGSGKGTQTERLYHQAVSLGKNVLKLSFPQYTKPSALFTEKYLNGEYGAADDIPADLASLAFAIDRKDASKKIVDHLADPDAIGLMDRYVASNLAHQGTKFSAAKERHAFYDRIMQLEYETLGIPRPDINIVLLMPTDLAQANVDKKDVRAYTTKKRDIHEADATHLERAKANYSELCELYPDEFIAVHCVDDKNKMRSIEDIHQEILQIADL